MNFMTLSSLGRDGLVSRARTPIRRRKVRNSTTGWLANARVGRGHALGIVRRSVDDALGGDRLLSGAPWTGPRRRDRVELVGQQIGERLVIDPPPLEVGPGLVGRAVHVEPDVLQPCHALTELR